MRIFLLYALLVGVFLAIHYVLIVRTAPACILTPFSILLLAPRLSIFAWPIAVCAGVGLLRDWLLVSDEMLLFNSLDLLGRMWRRLMRGLCLFSALWYAVVVCWLSPVWYGQLKQEMATQVVSLLSTLPSGRLHRLTGQCAVDWQGRGVSADGHQCLNRLRIALQTAEGTSVITATKTTIFAQALELHNGSIVQYVRGARQPLCHRYGVMVLPYSQLTGVKEKAQPARYRALDALIRVAPKGADEWYEIAFRLSSCLMMLLLPYGMLVLLPVAHRRRGSIAWRVFALALVLFCVLYVVGVSAGMCASWWGR